jgi:hypothetical protein
VKKYFSRFSSKKAFLDANLRPSTIQKLYDGVKYAGRGGMLWTEVKLILLHKNCPDNIRNYYAKNSVWYIRLVAMLNKHSWRKYALDAVYTDPKSTVRSAAIRRLWYEKVWTEKMILQRVRRDTLVQGYFKSLLSDVEATSAAE